MIDLNGQELSTWEELDRRIAACGLLPLFDCVVPGYSAASMTVPGMWFAGGEDNLGLWGWKIPVIRERNCAYGMFFSGKKGFVSLSLLPDFLNWRRSRPAGKSEDKTAVAEMVLEAIALSGSVTKAELRQGMGIFGNYSRRNAADPVSLAHSPLLSLDSVLSELQKGGRIVISEISPMSRGYHTDSYGWQVSSFSTPEYLFGADIASCPRTPEESRRRLLEKLRSVLPASPERLLLKLIG